MKYYSMQEILDALRSAENMPYSLYCDAGEQARFTAHHNPKYAWLLPYLQEMVVHYQSTPISAATFQAYANFDRIGERHLYDQNMYELRTRLNTMCLATLLDVEGAKAQCEDILYAFLHLPTWSLTAHLLDHSTEDYWDVPLAPLDETGRIRGLGRTRKQSQDLCSNGAAFALAEMAQLLEGRIEPCLLRWARQECYERVLGNFMSLSPCLYYEMLETNWSGVCMSSIGGAGIYLITDPCTLAPLIMRVLEGLRVYLNGFREDGCCPEGFGYWQYGFSYFLMFADLLQKRTAGRINLMDDAKVRAIASFGVDCCCGRTMKLPFSDANCRGIYDEALRRFFSGMGIPTPPEGDLKASFLSEFEHGTLQLRHLIWNPDAPENTLSFPRTRIYPISECYIGSGHRADDPIYLLVKGGNNGESHNHNDVGSFVIIRGDDMIAADVGGGDYCREYFREQRYTFFAARSAGHNVPMVDGIEQEGIPDCRTRSFIVNEGTDDDCVEMDLSSTLKAASLKALTRRITFRRAAGHVTVEDTFEMNAPGHIQDRVVTLFEPIVLEEGALRIGGETGMTLRFDCRLLTAEIGTVAHNTNGQDHVYTIDLIPRTENAGTVKIRMDWGIESL